MSVREPTCFGTDAMNSSPHVALSEGSVGQGVPSLGKTDQETTFVGRLAHSRLQFSDHAADGREACSHLPGMRKRSVRGLPAADRLRPSSLGSNLARPACRINHEGHGDTGCRANKQDLCILSRYV